MKCGFISLVGRPSTGKSTLINSLCQQRVAITSPKPQTTRNVVRGIVQHPEGQIILLDTPGYHNEQRPFSQGLLQVMRRAIERSNALLYLLDGSRQPGEEEQQLSQLLKQTGQVPLLVINKLDLGAMKVFTQLQSHLGDIWPGVPIHGISARKKEGLEALTRSILALLPEGEPLYPTDVYTDQSVDFRIGEVIREQAIACTSEEVPYSLYVEVADLIPSADYQQLWARVFILVERESQKGIVVGKGGCKIRDIRKESERILRQIFPYRVDLDIRVKVHPSWRQHQPTIKRLLG